MGLRVGVGVPVGPFLVGASIGRRRRQRGGGVGLFGVIFALALLAFLLVWPYMLGTWAAVALGAGSRSVIRAVVGWVLEVPWLVVVTVAVVGYVSARWREQPAPEAPREAPSKASSVVPPVMP